MTRGGRSSGARRRSAPPGPRRRLAGHQRHILVAGHHFVAQRLLLLCALVTCRRARFCRVANGRGRRRWRAQGLVSGEAGPRGVGADVTKVCSSGTWWDVVCSTSKMFYFTIFVNETPEPCVGGVAKYVVYRAIDRHDNRVSAKQRAPNHTFETRWGHAPNSTLSDKCNGPLLDTCTAAAAAAKAPY